eukprot:g73834.t1
MLARADPDAQDVLGFTPRMLASLGGFAEICTLLGKIECQDTGPKLSAGHLANAKMRQNTSGLITDCPPFRAIRTCGPAQPSAAAAVIGSHHEFFPKLSAENTGKTGKFHDGTAGPRRCAAGRDFSGEICKLEEEEEEEKESGAKGRGGRGRGGGGGKRKGGGKKGEHGELKQMKDGQEEADMEWEGDVSERGQGTIAGAGKVKGGRRRKREGNNNNDNNDNNNKSSNNNHDNHNHNNNHNKHNPPSMDDYVCYMESAISERRLALTKPCFPNDHIHNFWTAAECMCVLDAVKRFANTHGWTVKRHNAYPTTDVPCWRVTEVNAWVQHSIQTRLLPLIHRLY